MPNRLRRQPSADTPLWIVAPWVAVMFVLAFALHRGALVFLPLLALAVFILSPNPWLIVGAAVLLYGVILLGAALSGLVFAGIGPPLLRVPGVGTFLAFSLSALPYTAAAAYAIAVAKGVPWRSLPGGGYRFATVLVAVMIGGIATIVRHTEDGAPE